MLPTNSSILILFTPSRDQHLYFRELQKLFAAATVDTAALNALQKVYDQELVSLK
jgi:hypothetical protein